MLYDFLRNEGELETFVDVVLPEVGPDECFLLMLCARRKYLTDDEKTQVVLGEPGSIRREIVTDRGKLLLKVKELCVASGLYKDRHGRPIPQHAFAIYVTPNPRSYRKATVALITEMVVGLSEERPLRLESMVKTQLHRSVSRKLFLDLDVDPAGNDVWQDIVVKIKAILGETPSHVIRTRTGAHVLVRTQQVDKAVKRTFDQRLRELGATMEGLLEIRGDAMVPVPGTAQGGVMPVLVDH